MNIDNAAVDPKAVSMLAYKFSNLCARRDAAEESVAHALQEVERCTNAAYRALEKGRSLNDLGVYQGAGSRVDLKVAVYESLKDEVASMRTLMESMGLRVSQEDIANAGNSIWLEENVG